MMQKKYRVCHLLLGLFICGSSQAEEVRFDTPSEWATWEFPVDIVQFADDGSLKLKKFRKQINATLDAHLFTHPSKKRGEVEGGIWRAGSNEADAPKLMDGDPATYWQPDVADQLVDWSVNIDLGRPVLAREIKLMFPDEEGARPLRQFSVFVTQGARIQAQDDVFRYRKIFQTTKPNVETSIAIPLLGSALDTTRVLDADRDVDLSAEQDFQMVRLIRITADEKSSDAALAEIEVLAQGDNVSLGTLERGGRFEHGLLAREPQNMFDGNMDTFGNILTSGGTKGGWREGGLWWQVDLGALFWIDEMFIYFKTRGEGTSSFLFEGLHHGRGYNILFSDGRRTTGGDLDLTFLLREDIAIDAALASARQVRHIRYLFQPRKIRYIFWHGHEDRGWFSHPMEFMIFSPGYPAQVMLRSDFIDLGQLAGDGRAKAIKRLRWEATTPDQTQLQVRSRSGNVLQELYTFYDKKGEEVTETRYNSLPKVIRGPIDTMVVVGADWGAWSNFYQFSGEAFKSETPRRFIQLELILSTEDPAVAPVLHALALDFEDALVAQTAGQVMPRHAVPNEATQFTYTLWTNAAEGDSGFDRLRFSTPSAVDVADVRLSIGGVEREASGVHVEGDSLLFIDLPETVRTDSVALEFTTKVLRNATVFAADLGQEARPDLWQSVEAAERQANLVFLPDLPGSERLIGDLQVVPPVFSPNGDGINDHVQIRFALFKAVDASPSVRIFDLAGREVAALMSSSGDVLRLFNWDGLDGSGERVAPGVYVCRIDAGADAGQGEVIRTLAVAY
ncbi:MAG: hypothetical protein F4049_08580 [Gemmatimonadetes bacterium]|nr:hypothetical protein [Gemmatimonadota bacterium]